MCVSVWSVPMSEGLTGAGSGAVSGAESDSTGTREPQERMKGLGPRAVTSRGAAQGGRLRAHGAGALSVHPSPPSRSCPKPRGPGEPRLISSLCPGPHGPCANQRTVALAAGSPLPWPGLPAWGSSPAPSPAGTVRAAFPSEAQPQHPGGVTRRLSSRKGVHRGVTQHVSHHCSCPHSLLRSRTLWLVGGRLFPPVGSGSQAGKELGAKR